ncbi:MAG TPA: DUF3099 domain-containing protein [Nocardioidaceae bacterium]|nr:DUF3099 domain-containing protein [Nocardioidaceae bacterium]
MPRKDPEPIRITSATRSQSEDVAARQRRYIISMAIRTACFLAAVFVASWSLWLMWIFIIASFILPPVAVVVANAQAPTDPDPDPDTVYDPRRPELGPPPAP